MVNPIQLRKKLDLTSSKVQHSHVKKAQYTWRDPPNFTNFVARLTGGSIRPADNSCLCSAAIAIPRHFISLCQFPTHTHQASTDVIWLSRVVYNIRVHQTIPSQTHATSCDIRMGTTMQSKGARWPQLSSIRHWALIAPEFSLIYVTGPLPKLCISTLAAVHNTRIQQSVDYTGVGHVTSVGVSLKSCIVCLQQVYDWRITFI